MGWIMGDFIGTVITLVACSILTFGVHKVMQIAGDVTAIKELLRDIKRNTDKTPAAPSEPLSPESLVRAVHAASYSEIIEQALATDPEPRR
jgi:hypothetical protein